MTTLGGVRGTPSFNQSSVTIKNTNSSTHSEQVDPSAQVFFLLVYSLVFLVGLLLNGFTLKVYFLRAQQQTSRSVMVYLKNLVVADFLISLCLPIRIMNITKSSPITHWLHCNFGACAFYLNMYASIMFMGYIAANRYLKIVRPLGSHILLTLRAAHIVSVITWIFLLTPTFTYILMSLLTQEPSQSVAVTMSCEGLQSPRLSVLYKVLHSCSAIIFLVILISLVYFYYSTCHRLSLAQQKHPASPSSKKLAKSRRNILVLVIVFCICFVPYHLVRLPYAFLKNQSSWSQVFLYLKELTVMVSVFNVCLDPLIYFVFCKAFRVQLSLRRMFSTTQAATNPERTERRSSCRSVRTVRINGKMSLSGTTNQKNLL